MKGSMKSCSDMLNIFLIWALFLDHVRMWTAGIGPAQGKSFFFSRSPLEKKLIFLIEEKDGKSSMRDSLFGGDVGGEMCIPFVNGTNDFVFGSDSN